MIVGAPTVSLARRRSAASTCSTARPAAEITSIANPDASTTTGFGSAVASVGPNILIGSPDDNDGAGAALPLRSACDRRDCDVAHDVRSARRRRRQLRRRGRRHAEHGIDRRPGANLGTSDAGAAYLFDADPASPTFGQAIAAVQEPTPTSGDAVRHRGRVRRRGLDRGRGGRGRHRGRGRRSLSARRHDLASPPRQPTPRRSYDSVIVSGTFMDANPSAALTASINWGDGSSADRRQPPGRVLRLFRPARLHDRPGLRVLHDRRDPERRLAARPPSPRRPSPSATRRPQFARARPGAVVVQHRSRAARSPSAERSSAPAGSTPTRSRSTGATARADHDRPRRRATTRSRQPIRI